MSHENDSSYREDRERHWKEQERKEEERLARRQRGIYTLGEIENLKNVRNTDQKMLKKFFESGGFHRKNKCVYLPPVILWDDGLKANIYSDYYTITSSDSDLSSEICKHKIETAIYDANVK